MYYERLLVSALAFFTLAGCSKSGTPTQDSNSGPGTPASPWTITTVDSTGSVGQYTSIDLDVNDNPHISYLNQDSGYIMYAKWNGTSWLREFVSDARGQYVTTGRTSIALDGNGNPHISYHHADVAYYVSNFTGGLWGSPTMVPFTEAAWAFLGHNSIAVNKSNGTIHVALFLWNSQLGSVLGYWTPGLQNAQVADGYTSQTGKNNSIALDPSGVPHISYESSDGGTHKFLKYATISGQAWSSTIVDTIETTEGFANLTSIAVDGQGHPHIAYYSHRDGAYKYAKWNGASWELRTVDQYGSVGWESVTIAVDANGDPHIAYLAGYYRLKYARLSGSAWTIETVDASGDAGDDCSIKVGTDGTVHVSYYDGSARDLKYAKRIP